MSSLINLFLTYLAFLLCQCRHDSNMNMSHKVSAQHLFKDFPESNSPLETCREYDSYNIMTFCVDKIKLSIPPGDSKSNSIAIHKAFDFLRDSWINTVLTKWDLDIFLSNFNFPNDSFVKLKFRSECRFKISHKLRKSLAFPQNGANVVFPNLP